MKPLYEVFSSVPGLRLSECIDQLQDNKARWESERAKKDTE